MYNNETEFGEKLNFWGPIISSVKKEKNGNFLPPTFVTHDAAAAAA